MQADTRAIRELRRFRSRFSGVEMAGFIIGVVGRKMSARFAREDSAREDSARVMPERDDNYDTAM